MEKLPPLIVLVALILILVVLLLPGKDNAGGLAPTGHDESTVEQEEQRASRPITSSPFKEEVEPPTHGVLELRFHDHENKPVEGVSAEVIDKQTSNEEGLATWRLLPGTYSWKRASPHLLEFSPSRPPSRTPYTRASDGAVGWRVREEESNSSGEFTISAGETRCFKVLVHRGTSLSGIIPFGEFFPSWQQAERRRWHGIHLLHVTTLRHEADPSETLTAAAQARFAVVDRETGSFTFKDVPPGEVILMAWWRPDQDNYYVYRQQFTLQPGQDLFAGQLVALPTTREISLSIESRGREIPFDKLFENATRPVWSRVDFNIEPSPRSPADVFSAVVDIEPGKARIHGLPLLVNSAEIISDPRWPTSIPVREAAVDVSPAMVKITYSLKEASKTTMRLDRPHPKDRKHAFHYDFSRDGSCVAKGMIREAGSVELEPGTYKLLVHTQRHSRSSAPANLFFHGDVTVRPQEELLIHLLPGSHYGGKVFNPDRTPLANKVISFRPPGMREWSITTKTGADGSFTLIGMPNSLQGMLVQDIIHPGTGLTLTRMR